MAGIPQADIYFNIVFFVVIASVFIQGTSIPFVSKMLKLDVPLINRISYPIKFERMAGIDAELSDIIVPYNAGVVGRTINELGIPPNALIVLISRNDKFIIPNGSTMIEGGDVLLVLANQRDLTVLHNIFLQLSQ
jgi:cell volume regulation protein A